MSTWSGTVILGEAAHDYAPYVLDANATSLATAVTATTPWAYWKLDDASGAPQDSSGNARHGAVDFGSPSYHAAQVSTKGAAFSIGLDGTVRLTFPSPVNLGHTASNMAMAMLVQLTGTGIDGVSGHSAWRLWMGGSANDSYNVGHFDNTLGVNTVAVDGSFVAIKGTNTQSLQTGDTIIDVAYPSSRPHYVILNAVPQAMEIWLDGLMLACPMRDLSLGSTPDLGIGRDNSNFWGSPAMRASDVAAWNRILTHAEIQTLTEAALDATAFANAWQPQV